MLKKRTPFLCYCILALSHLSTEHTLLPLHFPTGEVWVCIDIALRSFGLSFSLLTVLYLKRKRIHPPCNKTVFLLMLQNIFHAVVEVPRWTNAKMEVCIQFILYYSNNEKNIKIASL